MIDKTKFGKTKDVMVAIFGTGDIWMLGSERGTQGETILAFKTVDPSHQIGLLEKASVETFDEMKPQLAFIFNKTESIDALIDMLKECRKEME